MVFYLDIDTVEEKDPIRVKIFALKCPNFTMVEATCLITHFCQGDGADRLHLQILCRLIDVNIEELQCPLSYF